MLWWFLKDKLHKTNITVFFYLVPDFLNKAGISDITYLNFIIEFNTVHLMYNSLHQRIKGMRKWLT